MVWGKKRTDRIWQGLGPVLLAFIAFQSSRGLVFLGVLIAMRWSG